MHWKLDALLTNLSFFIERFIPIRPRMRTVWKPAVEHFFDNGVLDRVAREMAVLYEKISAFSRHAATQDHVSDMYVLLEEKLFQLLQQYPQMVGYLAPYTKISPQKVMHGGIEYIRWRATLALQYVEDNLERLRAYSRPLTS